MLFAHPRGEQWRELDVTVTAPTFPQVAELADQVDPESSQGRVRARARSQVIAELDADAAGRMSSRWARWCSTFGLGGPPESIWHDPRAVLDYPFALAGQLAADPPRARWADFVRGVTAVFDAALGIIGAGTDPAGTARHIAQTAPWARVCLPCRFGPGDVFGPGHSQALALMRSALGLPAGELAAMTRRRVEIATEWGSARELGVGR